MGINIDQSLHGGCCLAEGVTSSNESNLKVFQEVLNYNWASLLYSTIKNLNQYLQGRLHQVNSTFYFHS